jgi:pimeloyl-ACP methyl ester carboxylesterase
MCENDFREVLPAIDKPMGILCARPGSLYDEETAAYIASRVQSARLYPIDKATHMVGFTHTAEVIEKLIAFEKEV